MERANNGESNRLPRYISTFIHQHLPILLSNSNQELVYRPNNQYRQLPRSSKEEVDLHRRVYCYFSSKKLYVSIIIAHCKDRHTVFIS